MKIVAIGLGLFFSGSAFAEVISSGPNTVSFDQYGFGSENNFSIHIGVKTVRACSPSVEYITSRLANGTYVVQQRLLPAKPCNPANIRDIRLGTTLHISAQEGDAQVFVGKDAASGDSIEVKTSE